MRQRLRLTWRNELTPGVEDINGIRVRRFPVKRERDPLVFGRHSENVFRGTHSIADELEWLDEEGPTSPALIDHLSKHQDDYDYCIIFSYRYRHAYHAVRAVAHKAILVPTAERDSAIGLDDLRANLQRRSGTDVQLARRAGDDSGRGPQR